MIGNLVEHSAHFGDIIGYENHSGQTFLDPGVEPLGRVDHDGTGNNGEDRTEGVRVNNVIGTYMHGSLLPRTRPLRISSSARPRNGVTAHSNRDRARTGSPNSRASTESPPKPGPWPAAGRGKRSVGKRCFPIPCTGMRKVLHNTLFPIRDGLTPLCRFFDIVPRMLNRHEVRVR